MFAPDIVDIEFWYNCVRARVARIGHHWHLSVYYAMRPFVVIVPVVACRQGTRSRSVPLCRPWSWQRGVRRRASSGRHDTGPASQT